MPNDKSQVSFECDVSIAGLGPVGGVLAALLAKTGASVFVADREPTVYPLPRAAHFDHEIMRIFQQLGIDQEIWSSIIRGPEYEFRNARGELLLGFNLGQTMSSGWSGFLMHQPGVEQAIRGLLQRSSSVKVRLGCTLKNMQQDPDGVLSVWTDTQSTFTVRSRYLIGCDGSSSAVRRLLHIDLDDDGFDEQWLVVDVLVEDPSFLPFKCLQICDPARPTTYVVMGKNRRRWEFMLLPGETSEEMLRDAAINQLLVPWNAAGKIEIERRAVYRFHALIAKQWRNGRVLIAGDAAHQMPPFAGQGMCSGVRDAASLAWRLDLIVRGIATQSLLDSYQTEREPHVRTIARASIETGRIVCTLEPDLAAARDRRMMQALADGAPPPDIASPPIVPVIGLPETPAAGAVFPQPWTSVGNAVLRMDDALGVGFWLLTRVPFAASAEALELGIKVFLLTEAPLKPFAQPIAAWLDRAGTEAVLVRPDRYVFGTGSPQLLQATFVRHIARIRLPENCAAAG